MSNPETSAIGAARHMLERAGWAARSFAAYETADVVEVVQAVAAAAEANAERLAELAVAETGFGVVADKTLKNTACSRGIVDSYDVADFVDPKVDKDRGIVAVPRPAGVVLALTPSTNPVATVFFKVILALMTRNAVVVSPHPMARNCCSEAADLLAEAAERAGAPSGVVQVVRDPTIPLVEALMSDERTNLILATGGTAVVRAAYASGNPAMGVGPGNVPVYVDRSADVPAAAAAIVASKAFDNSVLCTNESVVIAHAEIADRLSVEMRKNGAHLLDERDKVAVAEFMFPRGRLNVSVIGKPATWIAEQAGVRVPGATRLLVAPFPQCTPDEPMTHEKLSPVVGYTVVDSPREGTECAQALVRIGGAGHSAAIHARDEQVVLDYAAAVRVLRIALNVGNSTGSAGLSTNLALSMTIGTGFTGRSSLGENLEPRHLVNWTQIALPHGQSAASFAGLPVWRPRAFEVPAYPRASNLSSSAPRADGQRRRSTGVPTSPVPAEMTTPANNLTTPESLRDEIKRLVVEELRELAKR